MYKVHKDPIKMRPFVLNCANVTNPLAKLVFMMLKRPEGLVPSARRSRELHQEEFLQDAWLQGDKLDSDDEAHFRLHQWLAQIPVH